MTEKARTNKRNDIEAEKEQNRNETESRQVRREIEQTFIESERQQECNTLTAEAPQIE